MELLIIELTSELSSSIIESSELSSSIIESSSESTASIIESSSELVSFKLSFELSRLLLGSIRLVIVGIILLILIGVKLHWISDTNPSGNSIPKFL